MFKVRSKLMLLSLFAIFTSGCIKSSVNGTIPILSIESDLSNNRVLIWNSPTVSNQVSATLVLGQPDFYSSLPNNGGVSAQSLDHPTTPCTDGKILAVPDQVNNRILIWNKIPTVNAQAADLVLGQPNMGTNLANTGLPNPTSQTLNTANWCFLAQGKFIVSDQSNRRILIWNSQPSVTQQAADVELGEPDMFTNTGGTSAQLFGTTTAVYHDGMRLYISENNNNRVLIYNTIPTTSLQAPDIILGQPNPNTGTLNGGSGMVNSQGFHVPQGVTAINGHLFVADRLNNRVLIWNSIPTYNQQPADIVLGQLTMSGSSANQGGTASASTLSGPSDLFFDGKRFFISDLTNNRILGYNSLPTINDQAADFVFGQLSMSTVLANQGSAQCGPLTLSLPQGIYYNDNFSGIWRSSGY